MAPVYCSDLRGESAISGATDLADEKPHEQRGLLTGVLVNEEKLYRSNYCVQLIATRNL